MNFHFIRFRRLPLWCQKKYAWKGRHHSVRL